MDGWCWKFLPHRATTSPSAAAGLERAGGCAEISGIIYLNCLIPTISARCQPAKTFAVRSRTLIEIRQSTEKLMFYLLFGARAGRALQGCANDLKSLQVGYSCFV